MHPPLRERLGVAEPAWPAAEGRAARGVMARSLMYLFAAGGALTLCSLLFQTAATEETRIATTGIAAFALAAVLLVGYDRLPIWAFQLCLALGTVLIEWAIYASGENT